MRKSILLTLLLPLILEAQNSISVQVDTAFRSVPKMGLNGNTVRGPSWLNTEFNDSVASLVPDLLRYPGGNVTNYWNWNTGWFFDQAHLDTVFEDTVYVLANNWALLDSIDIRPIRFHEALNQINSEGVYVLNMMSSNVSDQMSILREGLSNGLTVDYFELGSEFNKGNDYSALKFPTAGDYARECSVWIDSIHSVLPNAQVAVVAGNRGGADEDRAGHWNDSLYSYVDSADALVWHQYFYLHEKDTSYTNAQVLAFPFYQMPLFEKWRCFEDTIAELQDYELWVTEYNLYDKSDDKVFSNTWAHVLFLSGMNNLLLENDQVTMMMLHNLGGVASFDAIDTENGFRKRATGIASSLWNRQMKGKVNARQLIFPEILIDSTQYVKGANNDTVTVSYPKLYAWKFDDTIDESAIFVNISGDSISVDVSEVFTEEVYWRKWTSDSLFAHIESETYINMESDSGQIDIVLAPYSINIATSALCTDIAINQTNFICLDDSLVVGEQVYTSQGLYVDSLISTVGCDSIVHTQVNIYPENIPFISINSDSLYTDLGMTNYQWFYNGDSIDGANAHYYILDTSGLYSVIYIDQNGCESMYDQYYVEYVGLEEVKSTSESRLIKIVDVLGREIETKSNCLMFYIYEDGSVQKRYLFNRFN